MVEASRVLVNGKPAARLDQILNERDRMVVSPARKETPRLGFPIIYEDADVLVINKPAGLLTSTVPATSRRRGEGAIVRGTQRQK